MGFDPNSDDAMFAKILQRMDAQDESLRRIEAGVSKTNGRVTALERWRDIVSAKAAAISAAIAFAAWLIERVFN